MDHVINLIVIAIQFLVAMIVELISVVDLSLANILTRTGVSPQLQLIILLFVAILIIMGAVRSVGPVLRALVIILLLLLLLHRVIPDVDQNFTWPGGLRVLPNNIPAPTHT